MIPPIEFMNSITATAACVLLAVAAMHDVGFRTLPDSVSVGLVGCGVATHLSGGDLGRAALAASAVFALAVLAWWAGALGGGDAKLLGSTALAVPLSSVPAFVLDTALAGGVLALGFLSLRPFVPAARGSRPATLLGRVLRAEAWRIRRRGPLPYAVAIAAGGAVSLLNG